MIDYFNSQLELSKPQEDPKVKERIQLNRDIQLVGSEMQRLQGIMTQQSLPSGVIVSEAKRSFNSKETASVLMPDTHSSSSSKNALRNDTIRIRDLEGIVLDKTIRSLELDREGLIKSLKDVDNALEKAQGNGNERILEIEASWLRDRLISVARERLENLTKRDQGILGIRYKIEDRIEANAKILPDNPLNKLQGYFQDNSSIISIITNGGEQATAVLEAIADLKVQFEHNNTAGLENSAARFAGIIDVENARAKEEQLRADLRETKERANNKSIESQLNNLQQQGIEALEKKTSVELEIAKLKQQLEAVRSKGQSTAVWESQIKSAQTELEDINKTNEKNLANIYDKQAHLNQLAEAIKGHGLYPEIGLPNYGLEGDRRTLGERNNNPLNLKGDVVKWPLMDKQDPLDSQGHARFPDIVTGAATGLIDLYNHIHDPKNHEQTLSDYMREFAVGNRVPVAKSTLLAFESIRGTPLDPTVKNSYWQDNPSSPEEVWLRSDIDLDTSEKTIQGFAKGDFDKIWPILQQSSNPSTEAKYVADKMHISVTTPVSELDLADFFLHLSKFESRMDISPTVMVLALLKAQEQLKQPDGVAPVTASISNNYLDGTAMQMIQQIKNNNLHPPVVFGDKYSVTLSEKTVQQVKRDEVAAGLREEIAKGNIALTVYPYEGGVYHVPAQDVSFHWASVDLDFTAPAGQLEVTIKGDQNQTGVRSRFNLPSLEPAAAKNLLAQPQSLQLQNIQDDLKDRLDWTDKVYADKGYKLFAHIIDTQRWLREEAVIGLKEGKYFIATA